MTTTTDAPAPCTDADAALRMRGWLLAAVASTWDGHAARGTLHGAICGCTDAHEFIAAVMQMLLDTVPGAIGARHHDIDACGCAGCTWYRAYDWDRLEPAYAVTSPAGATR